MARKLINPLERQIIINHYETFKISGSKGKGKKAIDIC